MGVLNVTPDSFSDGGKWARADAAIEHGLMLTAQGADIIDVGGESTRPGATRVAPDEEQRRIIPVVTELARHGLQVSIDTLNAGTARAAAEAGARIINDVSGGLADPAMAAVAAETGLTYVVMHWRAHASQMDAHAQYGNVVAEVIAELEERVDALTNRGVKRANIVLDPGLGFAKNSDHNWQILSQLEAFVDLGCAFVVGASRKRFLADVLPRDADVIDRDVPTAVISVLAAQAGAWAVRVHDVASTRAALRVLSKVQPLAPPRGPGVMDTPIRPSQ